jgi:predicted hotdog family 3-hydroxylacyl-ACP dehydratase
MDTSSISVNELLPHGPEMTVIDRLLSYDDRKSIARAEIRPSAVFFDRTGVPAWAGIEYMAQTIAAHAGFAARLRGEPPPLGFMLGTRAYACEVPEFPEGSVLTISVVPLVTEGSFAAFDCVIEMERGIATAVVNTYRPAAHEIARFRPGMMAS